MLRSTSFPTLSPKPTQMHSKETLQGGRCIQGHPASSSHSDSLKCAGEQSRAGEGALTSQTDLARTSRSRRIDDRKVSISLSSWGGVGWVGVALGRFSSDDFRHHAQLYCGILPFLEILIQQRQALFFFLAVLSPAALCITRSSFVFLRRGAGGNEADRPREPFKRMRRGEILGDRFAH